MPIPNFAVFMLPTLRFLSDGQEHSASELVEFFVKEFKLSDAERQEMLPSGQTTILDNRAGWARTYLKKAGLLEPTRRGFYRITPRGQEVIQQNPPHIDSNFLMQFPEFNEFLQGKHTSKNMEPPTEEPSLTLEETLENAYQRLQKQLAQDLLDKLKGCSPKFFEKVVVHVLVAMGYGGSLIDAGRAVGKSGDGGIDGIIKEDRLGLDVIYVQAKRWETVVGRPEIQKFVGALTGNRAQKGVFITTSTFSKEAFDYVAHIDRKLVLIDGETLTKLMIEHDVGVSTVARYLLKRIDSDYFLDD